mgnify:CR=1 FL=1
MTTAVAWMAPVCALIGICMAAYLGSWVLKQDPGPDKMNSISIKIQQGAKAFLMSEYKLLVIFMVVVGIIMAVALSPITALAFATGGVMSAAAGYAGMHVATRANTRTAHAAEQSVAKALNVSFKSGLTMGLCVASFALLGLSLWLLLLVFGIDIVEVAQMHENIGMVEGFATGASAVALFAPGDFQIGGKFAMEIVTHYVTTQLGVEIITEAPVTALDIQDGRAVGFTAEGADGTVYEVTAKAVVLASGGYIMNDELMHEYQPDDLKFPLMGPPWATGDGMLLAKDAGAAWICMDKGVTSHYHAGVSLAETSYIHYCVPGVVVNGNGERFVSESISYIVALRKFKEEPTTDFYWVFDDPASYGLMPNGNASRIDYSFLLETGDIVKGENYEDLAEKTGLFGLVATLDTVNDCAVNGAEDPFGNENLPALQLDGPMYAMKILPTPYIAQGGVKVDLSGHVQREDDSLIEGLYAVGDVTGALENRDGADYMIGLTQAVGYGLVVGETVAADLG